MGTRSLTKVFDRGALLMTMYRQYDGYVVGGHGEALRDFLFPTQMVNGFSSVMFSDSSQPEKIRVANGAGCLAAQLVAHFKKETGGFYIVDGTHADHGQEFEYELYCQDTQPMRVKVIDWNGQTLFEGTVDEFNAYVTREKVSEACAA